MGQTVFLKTSFWTDPKMIDKLTAQERFFYLYLMTTSQSNMVGCFEISTRITCSHTGFNEEEVRTLLARLVEYDVIRYSPNTHEVLILHYAKHNWTKSSKFLSAAYKVTRGIKDFGFKQYVSHKLIEYGFEKENFEYEIVEIDTTASNFGYGIQNTEVEVVNNINTLNLLDTDNQDNTSNYTVEVYKEPDPYKADTEEIVAYLNEKTGANYRPGTEETKRLIRARLKEGNTVEDFKKVIDIKTAEWLGTEQEKYLRPITLFSPSKFESYLNQKKKKSNPDGGDRWGKAAATLVSELGLETNE